MQSVKLVNRGRNTPLFKGEFMIEIYGKSACSACDTAKKLCESSGTVFAYKS